MCNTKAQQKSHHKWQRYIEGSFIFMLAVEAFNQNNCIQKLMITGRSIGYIYFADLSKCLPPELTDKYQIEDIVRMIEELGITVKR